MSLLKMTRSTRLYGAVSTFNDRGVFALAEDGADGEQDGGGTCDWKYTKDKQKPVQSGANYSHLDLLTRFY